MKQGIRVLAVACEPLKEGRILMVGLVSRDGTVEGVLSSKVEADGTDGIEKIRRMLDRTRFREQIRVIAMNGIGLAGLNIVEPAALKAATGSEVLSVTRKKPHPEKLIHALEALGRETGGSVKSRVEMVRRAQKAGILRVGGFYAQTTLDSTNAKRLTKEATAQLRLAHMIASGVSKGESKGRM